MVGDKRINTNDGSALALALVKTVYEMNDSKQTQGFRDGFWDGDTFKPGPSPEISEALKISPERVREWQRIMDGVKGGDDPSTECHCHD